MLQPIFRTLLQPSVARVSYPGPYVLRSVPNCFVRYKKNPWSPLAPTKLFLVKEHNIKDPKEMKELAILDEHYKTAMKALRYILFSIICTVVVVLLYGLVSTRLQHSKNIQSCVASQ